jgi:hypothetical protein
MHYTTFDRTLWKLNEFDKIGYDEPTKTLMISFLDGETRKYSNVSEEIVFQLVMAVDKDAFYQNHIQNTYPCSPVKINSQSPK